MIELVAGDARHPVLATVTPVDGGRIASLSVHGTELLVTGDSSSNPLHWGSYPMVPFAGRVRHGRFRFHGVEHRLPVNMAPHAIHGSGFTSRWDLLDAGPSHAELECRLTWPLGGRAHQHIQLGDEALVCVLTVIAEGEAMPVTIGWHPWFVKPPHDQLEFAAMYLRDDEGIPTGELVAPPPRPWDDCFVRPLATPELRYPGLTVRVESDCDHWVVYDQPSHATCVEPQSGPPDAVNLGLATVLEPGEFLQRSMTVSWLPAGSV
jgi:aldose 1-epimerase